VTTVLAVPVAVSVLETGATFTPVARTLFDSRSLNVTVAFVKIECSRSGSATLALRVTCAVVLLLPDVTKNVWPM